MSGEAEQRFSSRLGLVLSVLGIAVGTGNIWRFPRIAAQNGGETGAGAFLVAWVIFLITWSLPLIVAEYALGRAARRGGVAAFLRVAGGRLAWMGGFVALVATAIMFYYSVVTGWCLHYLWLAARGHLPVDHTLTLRLWEGFQAGPFPVLFHGLAIGLAAFAVAYGVRSIERISRVLIPALLVIVLMSVIRAAMLPGAGEGIAYLFTPQWSQLAEPQVWLEALTQNAWDTGAGWGLILTYAAYMRREDVVVKNAIITGVANNTVSLLAAMMIFGTVFAALGSELSRPEVLAVMKESGPASTGLTFIWIPQLLGRMQFGGTLLVLFFLALSFAALSSLISMVELAVRVLVDAGLGRRTAVRLVFGVGFSLGLPSAINVEFLGNQDFVWGVALMISGLFVAVAARHHGTAALREQFRSIPGDWDPGRGWEVLLRWFVPLQAIALLSWWLYLSATRYAPETWWNPLEAYSVASCILQWGLGLGILLALDRWLARRFAG